MTPRDQSRSPPMISTNNSPQTPSQPLARAIENSLLDPPVLLHEFSTHERVKTGVAEIQQNFGTVGDENSRDY
jgi:hypothetical protein